MRVLFIGGTGLISSACSALAVARGVDLILLNRGETQKREVPQGAEVIHADARDAEAVAEAIGDRQFDVVVNWIAFTPDHVEQDIELFGDRVRQYM
ncbi:MAG: NAD-dependent epimerase/dehydratase family protein, partial [Candidatus Brocadiia bacterium]